MQSPVRHRKRSNLLDEYFDDAEEKQVSSEQRKKKRLNDNNIRRLAKNMNDKQIQHNLALRGYDQETRTACTDESKREGCIRLAKFGQDSGWLKTWEDALTWANKQASA